MKNVDLFGNELVPEPPKVVGGMARNKDGSYVNNPMVKTHGSGPDGARCKQCQHLVAKHYSKVYYKCELRAGTVHKASPASDHRTNWPACSKFASDKNS